MEVPVPNKTFKRNRTHQFDSFVQYIRIYNCIGNFQEDYDTRHRFDTEMQHTRLYLCIQNKKPSTHDYHFRTVQSIQDDGRTIFNGALLEYGPVREVNLIYVAKR